MSDFTQLSVGVHGDAAGGWQRVLDQERIAHRRVQDGGAPITVFDGALPGWTGEYVAEGGVAVVSGALPDDPLLTDGRRVMVYGFTIPDRNIRCAAPGLVTVFNRRGTGEIRLHEDRIPKYGTDPDTFPVVHVEKYGRGSIVASGVPLTSLLSAPGDRLRRFAEFSPVTERVATVDKADIADTLLHMLRRAFEEAGLPLVTVPRFPLAAASVLVLRVDVDGVFGRNAMAIAAQAERAGVASSFYLNGDLCQRHPGPLGPWPGRTEVGQHAWTHTLYETVEDNLENLRRAQAWMAETGQRRPDSFVAPRGLWNPALGEALRSMGYRYSSDFGLDFDSLPFRSDGGILQVPVHPYSPERATVWTQEEGLPAPTAADVRDHYLRAMERQVQLRRPAHLYGHPEVLGQMAEEVVPPLARRALELGMPNLTLGEFADFWIRRESISPSVTFDAKRAVLRVELTDDGLPIEISSTGPVDLVVNTRARGRVSGCVTVPVTDR